MKVLTPEEEREHYNATLKGGLLGGASGLGAGTLGVYAASARYPVFRGLTLPFRAFLIVSTATFASIVSADHYSRSFEAQRTPDRQYRDESQSLQQQLEEQQSQRQKTMRFLSENRYGIVFGSWVASMGAALGIVGRDPHLTTQQKVVQARVWAQGFTLAAVVVSLAFEGGDRYSKKGRWETIKVLDPDDPTHQHIIEKRIHHEKYAGEDQWMDMVAAEEERLKERNRAVRKKDDKDKQKNHAK